MNLIELTPELKADIDRVVAHAHANPVEMERLLRMITGQEPMVGEDPRHVCQFPIGIRCEFSVDVAGDGRKYRILSVSVGMPGGYLDPVYVLALAEEFGFRNPVEATIFLGQKNGSVNVMEPVEEEPGGNPLEN